MVRSTTSPPLVLAAALALAGCHITIVPAPVSTGGTADTVQTVAADSTGDRPSRPFPVDEPDRPSMPAPPRIDVVSPEAWAGRTPGTLHMDAGKAVRVVGQVRYDGRVQSVRVNGDRASVARGNDGVTTFVAVVRPPRRGAMDVRVDVATPTADVSAVYALKVGEKTASLPVPPGPGKGRGIDEPPADTGMIVKPPRRGPPETTPPADSTPPEEAPPEETPPEETPPEETPPEETPPEETPPEETPPETTPPSKGSAADSAWAARDRWVVVIGVDEYASTGIPARRYGAEDARAMEAFLRSPAAGSIHPSRIRTLINAEATRDGIRAALTSFLGQAGRDDVVLVYLTGTGAPDPSHPNAAFVLPHDAPANPTDATAVSAEWIAETLSGLDVHQKILLADVLFADNGRGRGRTLNRVHRTLVRTTGPRKGDIVAITAASESEASQEGAQWGGGHGVFTHHVLVGLAGEGDDDRDGIISLAELVKHAREKVEGATGGKQRPDVSAAAYDRSWPLAVTPRR